MVRVRHGDAVWEEIKDRAGVSSLSFISNEPYPDEMTYKLVGAASEILKQPASALLEAFGEYWVLHTSQESYPDLMRMAGKSLPEYLQNLNHLHTRVEMIFPKLKPPRFECTDVGPRSLLLHHRTHREGMAPFTIGLVKGLGTMFGTPAKVTLVRERGKGSDHDVFEVSW